MAYSHDNLLRHRYGLSLEDYDRISEEQGHVCATCGGVNASGRRLSVDHCHKTGQIRGLLCQNCNGGLGQLKDDPALVRKALDYLLHYG
jgi:hypothetical protein